MRKALCLLALLGCADDPDALTPLPALDRADFAAEAGPLIAKRCGLSPCHGDAARPFNLFAPRQRRLPPTTTYDRGPLSDAEIDANYRATLGFLDADRAVDTLLVQKSLGRAAHGGGLVFEAPSDPECRAIRAWIDGVDR